MKNLFAKAGDKRDMGSILGVRRSPGGGNGNLTPVFLPGESLGQRSLAVHEVARVGQDLMTKPPPTK